MRTLIPRIALAALLVLSTIAAAQTKPAAPPAATPLPAAAPIGYKLQPGPYKTGAVEKLILHDDARDKDLEVVVRYPIIDRTTPPATPPTFPLIVFSHGMGGHGPTTFPELTTHWASHGYIVVLPTHTDSINEREQGKDFKNPRTEPAAALATVDLADRVADVSFILDSIDTLEARIPEIGPITPKAAAPTTKPETKPAIKPTGLIDRDRLAVAGHSAGAFTAQLAIGVQARGRRITGKNALTLAQISDPRLKAALIISGQGTTSRSLTKDSWSKIDKPILVLAGSKDVAGVGNETPVSRRHPFELSRGREKGGPAAYLLYIDGATHGSYQGKALINLLNEEPTTPIKTITDATSASTLAFLDAFIKDDAAAKQALESDAIRNIAPDKLEWKWK